MDKRKAIERARKLMAMAADTSSPNEAAIAARRARSLMDKFQLDADDLTESPEFGASSVGKQRLNIPQWEQNLVIAVARLNDCIAARKNGRLIFKGFAEDAEVASFMFLYLIENGKRTCKQFIQSHPLGCRNSFKLNYAWAIESKIREILKSRESELNTSSGTSLVLVKNKMVEHHFGKEKYREKENKRETDPISSIMGRKAGQQTNIVTGLHAENREPLASAL